MVMEEPEDEAPELKTCRRFGAEAVVVNLPPREFYVRVPRSSRCRATGIANDLENGGTLEKARQMAAHVSAKTTKLYDRRDERISLDEVERITTGTTRGRPHEQLAVARRRPPRGTGRQSSLRPA
jgi:hypothetical protein